MGLIIGTPLAIVFGFVLYGLFAPPALQRAALRTGAGGDRGAHPQVIPKDFSITQNTDLQIVEVAVDKSTTPNTVTGTLKNNTGQFYSAAELTFDLTDEEGSAVGGVSTKVLKIDPRSTTPFRFPIAQRNAAFVLVREARGTLLDPQLRV